VREQCDRQESEAEMSSVLVSRVVPCVSLEVTNNTGGIARLLPSGWEASNSGEANVLQNVIVEP
jgi:hypothetical protein